MKRNLLNPLFTSLLLIVLLSSCNKEEVTPTTGNVIVNSPSGTSYNLYTEAAYFAPTGQPLMDGNIIGGKVELKNLNAGNYMMGVFLTTRYIYRPIQVSAGMTKEYNF